jgi:hypothetical protein
MGPLGDISTSLSGSALNAAWRSRALQKPCNTNDLHGEQHDAPQAAPRRQNGNFGAQMHRNGTQAHVPFRHALRLTAPFTAQLLGQIMPDPERRPSAASRYASEAPRLSLGLDKRL